MQKITPYLWFAEEAEQAVNLYASSFKNSKVGEITRFGAEVPGPVGKVMTVSFQLAGQEFIALNGGPQFSFTPAVSFFVYCQTQEEIDMLWNKLSAGGTVLMELEKYPFSEKFGWLMDRFGVSWQLSLANLPQKINPYLLFVGQQHGKAEEAMHYYMAQFANSSISEIVHHEPGEDEPAGSVKHARFMLDGQEFIAMDSAREHSFTFTPAISFLINCHTQEEVDRFWNKLTEGGEEGQCGWLVDKFGVSWQVVPTILGELLSDPDAERAGRVVQAMLKMQKIEIGPLKQAYEQG